MPRAKIDARFIDRSLGRSSKLRALVDSDYEGMAAALLYCAMIAHPDDAGRFRVDYENIKGDCAPLWLRYVSTKFEEDKQTGVFSIEGCLERMASVGLVYLYEVNGSRYGAWYNFHEKQGSRRGYAERTKVPAPTECKDESLRKFFPEHTWPEAIDAFKGKESQWSNTYRDKKKAETAAGGVEIKGSKAKEKEDAEAKEKAEREARSIEYTTKLIPHEKTGLPMEWIKPAPADILTQMIVDNERDALKRAEEMVKDMSDDEIMGMYIGSRGEYLIRRKKERAAK